MKNRISNNFDEKKTKIKERLKLKLEYSEKIKNQENSKILKKLNNIKNKELPKIKVLNYLNHNSDDIDSFNYSFKNNNKNNSILYNKVKSKEIKQNKSYKTSNSSSENMQNMNLISYNENINNIYKKVTINDFNNKEINQKMFYNMIQNIDNILEPNTVDKKYEEISYNQKKISPKNSKNNYSFKNEELLLSILNQSKEDYIIPEEQNILEKNQKNKGNRFNFLRSKTIYNHKNINGLKKKYHTNKPSSRKVKINCDNENNLDILDTSQNTNNKKILLYDEDISYINKDKKNNMKKSFDLEIKNKDFSLKNNKDKNSEEESSDVTIESLCSEDIKDISSDFSNM